MFAIILAIFAFAEWLTADEKEMMKQALSIILR